MRTRRMVLSPNVRTHTHTVDGAHEHLQRAWILLHITSAVPPPIHSSSLSYHLQLRPEFLLFVLLSLCLRMSPVICYTFLNLAFQNYI